MKFELCVSTESNGKVAGQRLVIQKEALDNFGLVSKAQHKIIETGLRVEFHDVPQDWKATHRHHWLRDVVRDVADACAKPTTQDHGFHLVAPLSFSQGTVINTL